MAMKNGDDKDVAYLFELLDSNKSEKTLNEANWNLNFAYYMGDQWKRVNLANTARLFASGKIGEKNYTLNYIKPTVDIITARVAAGQRTILPQPKSPQSDDVSAARVAKMVVESLWDDNDINLELIRAIPVMANAGSVVVHPYFNASAGKEYSAEEINTQYGLTPESEDFWKDNQHEGRVEFDFLSPFEVSHDMGAKTDKDCIWWIVSKVRSKKWIKDVYNKDVKSGKDLRLAEAYANYKNIIDRASANVDLKDCTMVHELWHKKTKEYPKGLFLVVTEERELLYKGDLPWNLWDDEELPFYKMDYQSMLDAFWGKAPVTDARQPQRIINKSWSMYMNYMATHSYPIFLNPEGNGVDEQDISNELSSYVAYIADATEDGGRPSWLQAPQFNGDILGSIGQCKMHINEIFGVNDVSRAVAPAGIKSGRALQMLGSADDTRMGILQVQIESCLSKAFSMALRIIANTYSIPRMIKIVGKPNARFVKNFTGAMLKGNTDIKVKIRSLLPLNKAAAMDTVIALRQMGIIPQTEEGQRMTYQMLDFEQFIPMMEGGLDFEQAQYENSMLDNGDKGVEQEVMEPIIDPATGQPMINPATGQPYVRPVKKFMGIPRNDWDIDEIHIKVIEDRQKEIEYGDLIRENPNVHEAYTLHKEHHRRALLEKQKMMADSQEQQIQKQIQLQAMIEKTRVMLEAQAEMKIDDNKAQNDLALQRDKNKGEIAKNILNEGKNSARGGAENGIPKVMTDSEEETETQEEM